MFRHPNQLSCLFVFILLRYRKICFKIHAAVFRAEVQFQKSPVMYQSLNDIKVWRLISIFAKLDTFEENGLF